MKLDLNTKIKNMDGVELEGSELNKILANSLIGEEKNIPAVQAHDWALKLWNEGIIEIEEDGRRLIEEFVQGNKTLHVLAKAPLLRLIKAVR